MNSPEEIQQNELLQSETNADNQFTTADNNANLSSLPAASTGAIPKTKAPTKTKSSSKKPVKLNNNLEEVSSLNCQGKENVILCNGTLRHNYIEPCKCDSISGDNKDMILPVLEEQPLNVFDDSEGTCCNICAAGENLLPSQPSTSFCERLKFEDLESRNCGSYVSSPSEACSSRIGSNGSNSAEKDNLAIDLENSDSCAEDELLSISDDGCIYTYKGDHVADLPRSFFSLDVALPEVPEPQINIREQSSSPEMDYLEMDFDPGPLGDGDSECGDLQNSETISNETQNGASKDILKLSTNKEKVAISNDFSLPSPSTSQSHPNLNGLSSNKKEVPKSLGTLLNKKEQIHSRSDYETSMKMPWSCKVSQRTTGTNYFRTSKRFHCVKGELISPNEKFCPDYSKVPKSYYTVYNNEEEWRKDIGDSAMIWSEQEALLRQFTQVGPSACGASAVLNVLTALRFPIPPIEKLMECVNTRLRENSSPLTQYLLSRSVAGTTHEDLIEGLHKLSDGKIYARFFHMYPERVVNLDCWLAYWIANGAIPVATLNLQMCSGTIPDAWHHQMIFGVSPKGIFLTNPLECVDSSKLWPQLCSESTLLIRREDVISRWNYRTDLPELMKIMDVRWRNFNVVGQVANMIHEHRRELRPGFTNTSHIKLPASYSSGITLAVAVGSSAYSFLKQCPELELLHPYYEATALPTVN